MFGFKDCVLVIDVRVEEVDACGDFLEGVDAVTVVVAVDVDSAHCCRQGLEDRLDADVKNQGKEVFVARCTEYEYKVAYLPT